MADRLRINVTLARRDIETLGWLAGERTQLPAALARTLIEQGLQRAIDDAALQESYRDWRSGFTGEQVLAPEIVAALRTPGVVDVLMGKRAGATMEQLRLASWLCAASEWITDKRPNTTKGPAPRRDCWADLSVPGIFDGEDLDEIDEAVSQALRAAPARGAQTVSDKRQLSDVAPPPAPQGVDHVPTRR
jgi:hypothetical protein